jgi:type IV secretory pathway VirB10-like protein
MLTPRIGLVAVAAACVVAAGTGGYVATRQLNAPASAAGGGAAVPAAAAPVAVHETEAVMDELPLVPEPAVDAQAPVAAPREPAPPPVRPAAPRQSERVAQAPVAQRPPAARPAPRTQPPARVPADGADESGDERRAEAYPVEPEPVTVPELPQRADTAPTRAPQREFRELVVERDSVVGLQLESTVSSESAEVEDRVAARVTRDVTVDGRVAIPAGSRVHGSVSYVDRGGKMKERARLGVRFHTLVLADGTSVPIQTETVYRDGESPTNASAAKIGGGAIGGAIIGGILGGARGAVIGGSTGAAGGTAAVMAGSRRHATIAAGSSMTVRVLSPVTVTVEQ